MSRMQKGDVVPYGSIVTDAELPGWVRHELSHQAPKRRHRPRRCQRCGLQPENAATLVRRGKKVLCHPCSTELPHR